MLFERRWVRSSGVLVIFFSRRMEASAGVSEPVAPQGFKFGAVYPMLADEQYLLFGSNALVQIVKGAGVGE